MEKVEITLKTCMPRRLLGAFDQLEQYSNILEEQMDWYKQHWQDTASELMGSATSGAGGRSGGGAMATSRRRSDERPYSPNSSVVGGSLGPNSPTTSSANASSASHVQQPQEGRNRRSSPLGNASGPELKQPSRFKAAMEATPRPQRPEFTHQSTPADEPPPPPSAAARHSSETPLRRSVQTDAPGPLLARRRSGSPLPAVRRSEAAALSSFHLATAAECISKITGRKESLSDSVDLSDPLASPPPQQQATQDSSRSASANGAGNSTALALAAPTSPPLQPQPPPSYSGSAAKAGPLTLTDDDQALAAAEAAAANGDSPEASLIVSLHAGIHQSLRRIVELKDERAALRMNMAQTNVVVDCLQTALKVVSGENRQLQV